MVDLEKTEQPRIITEGKANPEPGRRVMPNTPSCPPPCKGGGTKENAWWQPALVVFARMSGWIAAPVVIALFVGKWLDRKYGTGPWLLLASVGVSFLVSMAGIVKEAMSEYKKIERGGKTAAESPAGDSAGANSNKNKE